jgi:alcohol dehydrogenase
MTGFFTSPRVAWGPGALEQLSGLGARRAFLVVDRAVAGTKGHLRIVEELAKSETVVEVAPATAEPDHAATVEALAKRLADFAPDWIIAVGGGRTVDGAKAARLLFERPDLSLRSVTPVLELPDPPRCRLVAVPTTSGSGADASWAVDLIGPDGEPVELAHRSFVPEWAIVDGAFSESLSNDLRRDGGVEALVQATEAFLSAWSNPFSDALALSVARTVFERLPHAIRWSDDPEAKEDLHYAATLAGLASSNAQRGVAHALARALVAPTGLPYAQLLGIALPSVLDFDHPSARDRLETLGHALRRPDESSPVPVAARLRRFYELLRFPGDLASAGVPPDRLADDRARITARVLRTPGVLANPRVPSAGDVDALLASMMSGPPTR